MWLYAGSYHVDVSRHISLQFLRIICYSIDPYRSITREKYENGCEKEKKQSY